MNFLKKPRTRSLLATVLVLGLAPSFTAIADDDDDDDGRRRYERYDGYYELYNRPGLNVDVIIGDRDREYRRRAYDDDRWRYRHYPEKRKYKDGKSEYHYDDGRVKVEEKIDRRANKYEYVYDGPDGKCVEKYDQGKYEYKCDD